LAVASPYGFCAIFSLKEAHEIAREIESSNPAHPATFTPFLEVRISRPRSHFMLTSSGTVPENGWHSSENGFSTTTFAPEESGYAPATNRAEKWNIYASIFLGHTSRSTECETKPMQRPETTTRR